VDARTWVELGIGLATIALTTLASLWAGSRNAAKWEGAAEEKFVSLVDDVKRLDRVDGEQWSAINAVRRDLTETQQDVARIEGAQQAKANGAAHGRP
jgi:SPX domain protein involved in polyphosphate accumulation